MRILMMLPGLTVGGMERAAVTIANALSRRGHRVTMVTYGSQPPELASELDAEVRFIPRGLKPHPLMRRIPWVRHRFYDDGRWESRTSAERLYRFYADGEEYDAEIAFFRGLSVKTLSAKRRRKMHSGFTGEVVMHPRRLAWVHSDFTRALGWDYNFRTKADVARAYRSYDHVVCVSDQARRGFIDTLGDTGNLTTIYNMLPVDDILTKAQAPIDSDVEPQGQPSLNVVLVARLEDRSKGQLRLIDAVAALRSEGIHLRLTMVGAGPDEERIRRHIHLRGVESAVRMVGSQRNPYPYIRQADLLVCSSYYEGYNLTVAEALIIGTPVLSTRCTGPVEILDDGCYGMIVDNSTAGLIDGLRRLATDPDELRRLRALASARRPFFDPSSILHQIESLLN